jgi:hypothetical protein
MDCRATEGPRDQPAVVNSPGCVKGDGGVPDAVRLRWCTLPRVVSTRTLYAIGIWLSKSARVFSKTGAKRSSSSSLRDEMIRMCTKPPRGLKEKGCSPARRN